ncbi:hypothetical protein Cpap_1837 [Ruminiclostridium papyrosolvens DSM 2782]|uniref:Uncharacterized protein n=1 Tax=Ruminiclostridium papyrosolvens DSM 2782 TaxID=588581 RepID=F1TDK4_9FIRM|nr:hypothetical protein [Ruminiclostridium papyrosolvens]EGD47642.1 hypothetical protein Cpap_1837 [Ruminiclostridium papyrosolvens DSM 2782]
MADAFSRGTHGLPLTFIAFKDYMTIVVRILVVALYTIAILGLRLW